MEINNIRSRKGLVPLIVAVAFTAGCSGSSEHEGPVGTARMDEGVIKGDGSTEVARDTTPAVREEQKDVANTPVTEGKNNDPDVKMKDQKEPTPATKEKNDELSPERRSALNEVDQLKKELDQELTKVKDRLRAGTGTADEKKADRTRSSELTKSIRRLGRMEKDIRNASDEKWAETQKEYREELNELRALRSK